MEQVYDATLAGLSYDVDVTVRGLRYGCVMTHFLSYSHTIPCLRLALVSGLRTHPIVVDLVFSSIKTHHNNYHYHTG